MSHNSTPSMHHKKMPPAPDSAGDGASGAGAPEGKPALDWSASVSDAQATNTKQLLNAYVYDFLVKSRLPQTARIFVREAEVPVAPADPHVGGDSPLWPSSYQQFQKDHNLPKLAMAMDAPQGFLFEWWQVFWDVFNARNQRSLLPFATQFYQLHLMKQREQHDMLGMNHTAIGPQQAEYQRMMMKKQQPPLARHPLQQFQPPPQQFTPQMQPQPQPQPPPAHPQPQLANMPTNGNLTMQQHMFLQQQQQQPQPQQLSQNRIQQQAQTQMNNLRQQAVAAQQHKVGPAGEMMSPQPNARMFPGQPGAPPQQMVNQPAMQHFQQMPNGQGAMPFGQQQQPLGMPQQHLHTQQQHLLQQQLQQQQQQQQQQQAALRMSNNAATGKLNGAIAGAGPNSRNLNALQDYQMQLMLLEKQNKKRLDIARNNGNGDAANMLPPGQVKASPHANSPVINNKPSPGATAAKRKAPAARKKKASVAAGGDGDEYGSDKVVKPKVEADTAAARGFKDDSVPLTPVSETPIDSKRKRDAGKNSESPKRAATKKAAKEKDPKDKTEDDAAFDANDDAFPGQGMHGSFATSAPFPDLLDPTQEPLIPVDVTDGAHADTALFGSASNGLDFDFNLFLDGGPDNDGIASFTWGNDDA
jgi:hypothetical protein